MATMLPFQAEAALISRICREFSRLALMTLYAAVRTIGVKQERSANDHAVYKIPQPEPHAATVKGMEGNRGLLAGHIRIKHELLLEPISSLSEHGCAPWILIWQQPSKCSTQNCDGRHMRCDRRRSKPPIFLEAVWHRHAEGSNNPTSRAPNRY